MLKRVRKYQIELQMPATESSSETPTEDLLTKGEKTLFLALTVTGFSLLLLALVFHFSGIPRNVDVAPVIGIIATATIGLAITIFVPRWQCSKVVLPAKDRLDLENQTRDTLIKAISGTVLLVGIYFTWSQVASTQDQLKTARLQLDDQRQTQVRESFVKAIGLLSGSSTDHSSDKPANTKPELSGSKVNVLSRLAGVYQLAQIAKDPKQDKAEIWTILAAMVKIVAKKPIEETGRATVYLPVSLDVQAAMQVLGKRQISGENTTQINLANINLSDADLKGLHLDNMDFTNVHFGKADLRGATVKGSVFLNADLREIVRKGVVFTKEQLDQMKYQPPSS